MTWPREGSRETDEGIIISEAMDWCRSPTAIVPYRLYAYQREATNLADSVRQTDDRTHVKNSVILASYGDEPGVGGGVISGTHNAECTPKTWSESVRVEGRNVVRHDDEWWMNHKNTWGRLQYVKDTSEITPPEPKKIDQKLVAFYQAPGTATDASTPGMTAPEPAAPAGGSSAMSRLGTTLGIATLGYGTGQMAGQYYLGQDGNVAVGITNYQMGQVSPFSPQGQAIGGALGFPGSMSRIDEANNFLSLKAGQPVDFRNMPPDQLDQLVRQPWPSAEQIKKNGEALKTKTKTDPKPKPLPPPGFRTSGNERKCPCIVGTYEAVKPQCKAANCGGQAHHIVADKYLRLGNRASGEAGIGRIKGMPSFGDGPAICLNGNAGDEDSDHNIAHQNDGLIEAEGNAHNPQGTLPIGRIRTISVEAAKAAAPADPECQSKVEGATGIDKYGGNPGALVRSSNNPPAPGSPAMNYFRPPQPIQR